ncbi:MAG: hypothetical protein HVN35_10090 [Methanobacteriaceae archaeon]|nr:hypothetical protein [Methanobacteriaceae archaeon]
MFLDKLAEDKKGIVFSIDLMLALILITVILGVSANTMDIVGSKMQDYSYAHSLERITMSGADMLIKTPGSPENWEELMELNGITPGLAEIDSSKMTSKPNVLSKAKIERLKQSYDLLMLGKVIPEYCNSTLIIYPVDQCLEPIVVKNISTNQSSSDVWVVNRTVMCNYINTSALVFIKAVNENSTISEQNNQGEICPHSEYNKTDGHRKVDFENRKPGWICYHFRVTKFMLESTDFYVMTDPEIIPDPSAGWMIDRPENMSKELKNFNNKPVLVNERINECLNNNTTAVLWFHVFYSGNLDKSFNTYLAGFPKGTPTDKVKLSYLNPQPCYFVFRVWY